MTEYEFLYRTHFPSFVDFAFRELHPGEVFQDNWHIQLMASMLQFLHDANGEVNNRMIFNLPPGYLKTHICAIAFPCWVIGRDPRKSVLLMSETPELA